MVYDVIKVSKAQATTSIEFEIVYGPILRLGHWGMLVGVGKKVMMMLMLDV